MNIRKFFLLSWKKVLLIIVSWFLAVILHNVVSGLLGVEEPVFFITAVIIIPLYTLIVFTYSAIIYVAKLTGT